MSDYKQTLNLPQTDFPMKANLAQREPEMIKKWGSIDLYAKLRAARFGKKKFILLDGPPYANGRIHVGHAVNKILKDMIIKAKTLSDFDAPYIPGWDCHGLPIEMNVEKKHGKPGRKITASAFREACREYVSTQVALQRDDFIRLGVLGDWDHPYRTMDFDFEASIIRSLAKIIANNHLQKGFKPVHWCLDCASALAEAEVEYADKTSLAIDVSFGVIDKAAFLSRFSGVTYQGNISIPIWTTTPWSLPANEAVALNAEIDYVLVDTGNEALLIAEALVDAVMARYNVEAFKRLGAVKGEKLAGLLLQHPFYPKHVPIILGDHVTIESGTGAVHTAPAHGQDDYVISKQYDLPIHNPVGDDGVYISTTPLFAGVHVSKANDLIVEKLKEQGALLLVNKLTHSYPHCWRHKTPLIFRATPQWFISMEKGGLRAAAMEAIERIEWLPDWGKARIQGMISNRPDWCISRQRTWGVPLALFIHKETGELHPDTVAIMEKVAKKVEETGIEAWFSTDAEAFIGKDAEHYSKVNDVLDVWFDSGALHEGVLRAREGMHYPADLILEGSDQHRGWFQSMLLTAVAINNQESYQMALTHGFVVDGQGRKMSKSLGNVIAPDEVVQSLGADILRLWVASIDYRTEIAASKEILNRTAETYRRIRNTVRFLLANLNGFDPAIHLLPADEMLPLDRWVVDKARTIQADIIAAYDSYQFHTVVQKLHHFCLIDLGGFYLDIIKDRQYTMAANSRGRRSAQTALYHIAHAMVRWMAPVLSFTADEVWQYLPGKNEDTIFTGHWYADLATLPTQAMDGAFWEQIIAIRTVVNKEIENARNAGLIGSALEAEVQLYCDGDLHAALTALQDELRFVLITSDATVHGLAKAPSTAVQSELPGLKLIVAATVHEKCERCWHRREDVNKTPEYSGLCSRCVENVAGDGEKREFA